MFQFEYSEAVVLRCFVKKVFLENSENWQENTCVRDSFLIKLQAWGLHDLNHCMIWTNQFYLIKLKSPVIYNNNNIYTVFLRATLDDTGSSNPLHV